VNRHLILALGIILGSFSLLFSQNIPVVEKSNQGTFDWSTEKLSLSLQDPSRHSNINSALTALQKQYALLVQSLRLDTLALGTLMESDPLLKDELLDVFNQAQIEGLKRNAAGYNISIDIPLYGETGLATQLYYRLISPESKISGDVLKRLSNDEAEEFNDGRECFTGLIVDSAGLGLYPSIVPEIVSESGFVVYGPSTVDFRFALHYGIGHFALKREGKWPDKRLGKTPLIVRALRSEGLFKHKVVLSNTDSAKVIKMNSKTGFLEQTRVLFLL